MRVFVAGATGVIGVRLVPLLVAAGHEVAGMMRSSAKVELLPGLGAEPVVCDVFDAAALHEVVTVFQPEAVVNELTDLPGRPAATNEANARMRRQGGRTCSPRRRRPERRAFSRRALPGSYPGTPARRSANSNGSCSRPMASFSGTDGCTAPAPTTKTKTRSHRAFTSTRPPGAPCRQLRQPPGSSRSQTIRRRPTETILYPSPGSPAAGVGTCR